MLIDRVRTRRVSLLSSFSALLAIMASAVTLADFHVYDDALMPGLLLGTLGFDAMSLIVGIGLLACLWAVEHKREQYWLPWLGLQAYLLYAYSIYSFGLVYTRLYFLYVGIVGLSAYALAGFALHFDARKLRHWPQMRLPRRTMGAVLVAMGALFAVGWTVMLADALARGEAIAAGIVLVLDLAFSLPLLVIVGLLLFRRRPLGDLLATSVFLMSGTITLAVVIGEFLRPVFGESFNVWPATPYLLPGAVCLALALLAFRRVGPAVTHARP
ncbi:MAG: hypothetical protein ACRENU_13250 [Gemmatimonadaceae bacterium]